MRPTLQRFPLTAGNRRICQSCLFNKGRSTRHSILNLRVLSASPSRKFASAAGHPPQPPNSAFTHLRSRRLILLHGPDSTSFLQGVITANIASASCPDGLFCAFLNAQGRLINDVFIYPEIVAGDAEIAGWMIEIDAAEAERLAKHIQRYKLRAKFKVRLLDVGEANVWSLWNEDESAGVANGWTPHSLQTRPSEQRPRAKEGIFGCADNRALGMGRRLILPGNCKPEEDLEETTEDAYKIRRYLKGVAEGQSELLREASLPQESNIDFMGGIDYRKGCYVGQELTIRTHHTGVVRKRILPVMIYGKDDPAPSTLEYLPDTNLAAESIPLETSVGRWEKRGRSAGKWLSGVGNIGLGLCRLETMTDLQIQGEAGRYQPGDEFKLEWQSDQGSDTVKVKAFVPSWHLTKS